MQAESQWNIKYLIQLAKLVTNILRKTKIVCEAGAPHPASPRADSTNKWYQRDMITGRRLLSDQRRPTKGGGENFSNPAESLTQKGTISKLSPCARATRGVFQSKCGLWFALSESLRRNLCPCCAGNNPLISQSAIPKQTHM